MAITSETAIEVGQQIFAEADRQVRAATGESIITSAFDLARPALEKVVPAAFLLLPIVRNVILPMVENALTPDEYDAVVNATAQFDAAVKEIVAAVTTEQQRILGMSDAEIDQYARDNRLYRDVG